MSILDDDKILMKNTDIFNAGFPSFEDVEYYSNNLFGYTFRNDLVFEPEVYPKESQEYPKKGIIDPEDLISINDIWFNFPVNNDELMSRTIIVSCKHNVFNNIKLDHDKYTIELSIGYMDDLSVQTKMNTGYYDVIRIYGFKDEQLNDKLARKKAYELLELIRDYPKVLYALSNTTYTYNLKELKKLIKTHKNELA